MKEQLITFETAKLAKEKGFEGDCYYEYGLSTEKAYFNTFIKDIEDEYRIEVHREHIIINKQADKSFILAPTQSLLQKWLREKHNVLLTILPWKDHKDDVNDEYRFRPMIVSKKTWEEFKTYEEALEKGLFEALKLI